MTDPETMSSEYCKLYASLYEGSMVGAGAMVFALWPYIISHARVDQGSTVTLNPRNIGPILGEPEDKIQAAIEWLCRPDPQSRCTENEGRRLIRLSPLVYKVTNLEKYDEPDAKSRRKYWADRKSRQRANEAERIVLQKQAELGFVQLCPGTSQGQSEIVPYADADADADANANADTIDVGATQSPPQSDKDWLDTLKRDPTYTGIDVLAEYGKMLNWCRVNKKLPSRRRFINWVNRAERPMQAPSKAPRDDTPGILNKW